MARNKSSALALATAKAVDPGMVVSGGVQEHAFGGGLEGASQTSRELARWQPMLISPDRQIALDKQMSDLRGRDAIQNDGYTQGALQTHRDSIVGAQYRLNATPDWEMLGSTAEWAEAFQTQVENEFNLMSDSRENWFDARRMNTLTGLIRMGVSSFFMTGEVLASVEWIRQIGRPFSTAIQMISPTRMSNPDGNTDTTYLRRGKAIDSYGAAQGYYIRNGWPGDAYGTDAYSWTYVPARKPWGRLQMIHIFEGMQPEQNRGIADIVAVLKQGKMTSKFQDVTLQNAVVNATYAAAIESELPSDVIFAAMGAGQMPGGGNGMEGLLGTYLDMLGKYMGGSSNIAIDGVKMPHLFPGTKLSMKPMGTPGGVGTDYEASLQRHIAAGLGLSYEQFTKDFSKSNYSSFRGAMGESWKFMSSRKKIVADGIANDVYALWMEERINQTLAGTTTKPLPLPAGWTVADFYDPFKKAAILSADWIGASKGQVDELKETQAAMQRIAAGLSTYEAECARLGTDWRKTFMQRSREEAMKTKLGLQFNTGTIAGTIDAGTDDTDQQPGTPPPPSPGSPAPAPKPKKKAVTQ